MEDFTWLIKIMTDIEILHEILASLSAKLVNKNILEVDEVIKILEDSKESAIQKVKKKMKVDF